MRDRSNRLLVALAIVLAVAGVIALVVAAVAQQPSPPTPAVRLTKPAPPQTPAPSQPVQATELGPSDPVRVRIPRIEVSAGLEQLGLNDDGSMQVPKDPARAGWFSPSPAPGVIGSSVLAGHVTWNRRPAVFFRLGALQRGDIIEVARSDGVTTVFTVDRVARYAKDSFPTDQVYDSADYPALRLITCGGRYDEKSHRYLDNVIVWAHLTSHGAPSR